MNDSLWEQEPTWPQLDARQALWVMQERCQELLIPKKGAGRPPTVSWSHLCLAIQLVFSMGVERPIAGLAHDYLAPLGSLCPSSGV